MQFPIWLKPALYGAVTGAAVISAIGFGSMGWTTASAAESVAKKQAGLAVVAALVPYCVQSSASTDPAAVVVLADLAAAQTYGRRAIVEKAGWATPLGATAPNTDLAQACQLAIGKGS